MKQISTIRRIVMQKGERAYCRGFAQAVFFAAQRLITPGHAAQFVRDGEAEDWSRQIDPITGWPVIDYFPARHISDVCMIEIAKRRGLESEIAKLWEKRYRDGFYDGWTAFRKGEVDLYEATRYRYEAARRGFKSHKDPLTRETIGLTTATLRAMNEIRDCESLRQLFF